MKAQNRVLYVSDVPVEESYHGSALLYRLLETYPSDQLLIIEAGLSDSLPSRRLKDVQYVSLLQPNRRLLHSRLHHYAMAANALIAPFRGGAIRSAIGSYQPDCVLTVAHGFSWMTAAAFARRRSVPFHLIVHDDWPRIMRSLRPVDRWVERQFSSIYRRAASRLCVSPYMVNEYEKRYGCSGTVLYPSRSVRAEMRTDSTLESKDRSRSPVFAFGGTINTAGHVAALRDLASALATFGATLNIYGPLAHTEAEKVGLALDNVRLCGLISAGRFLETLRDEADVLFLPMSFAQVDRENMSFCFPSKLTDYTAAGLPIMIYGPEYSSAVRWSRDNGDAVMTVTEEGVPALKHAAEMFCSPEFRATMARRAVGAGERTFNHSCCYELFRSCIATSN